MRRDTHPTFAWYGLALATWRRLRRHRDSLSQRDRVILALAAQKLGEAELGGASPYATALRVLHAATAETIPAGRIYLLGNVDDRPVVGSLISQVGIVEARKGVEILRLRPKCAPTPLGALGPRR